jgi:segregation and condensation protein A
MSVENSYIVHLELFEGPLDLLLHLVKVNEIDIYEIPIAQITNQYLEYINLMEELNINVESEFLVIAATLIYLKSCELLPPPPGEEYEKVEDLKAEFTRRLVEYQAFKAAAENLSKKDKDQIGIFVRPPLPPQKIITDTGEVLFEVNLFDLLASFKEVLEKLSIRKEIKLKTQRYHVEDKIAYIRNLLESKDEISLISLFEVSRNKAEAITFFLAMLELIKEKIIMCVQKSLFSDILIMKYREFHIVEANVANNEVQ